MSGHDPTRPAGLVDSAQGASRRAGFPDSAPDASRRAAFLDSPRGPIRRAVFLDRDGVLIASGVVDGVPHPPPGVGHTQILPGVAEALALLKAAGFLLIAVTNQPDVARGIQTRSAVEEINDFLRRALPLNAIYVCYHDNADRCACRKPAPGMLLNAAHEHAVDLHGSWMIGDRGSDIEAGSAAGCATCLIEFPYSRCDRVKPTLKAADLLDAARKILAADAARTRQ